MEISEVQSLGEKIRENIGKVIVGKNETANLLIAALLAGGHALLEDVPGTGKTVMAKSLARSIGARFTRVQFTPDLLPSDLTGINYFNQKVGDFSFRKGPLFTNILLADEINRATPRTQSSLLECMEERQVTVDGVTYQLEPPYFVIATQNPVETQGTFPLPEAQLDRFLVKTNVGYPETDDANHILQRFMSASPLEKLDAVCTGQDIVQAQTAVKGVYASDALCRYIIDIVEKTRTHAAVSIGVSPRGSLAMLRISQAHAALAGRIYVTPEDVKALAPFVFAHRIIIHDDYTYENTSSETILSEVLGQVPVPTEQWKPVA